MILTLEVTGAHAGMMGADARKTFDADGGTIGRSPASTWCLQDSHVSKQHARISADDQTFYVEDTNSSNGVVLNAQRLQRGRRYPIADGDHIFIDPFEIIASVQARPGDLAPPFEAAPPPLPSPMPAAGLNADDVFLGIHDADDPSASGYGERRGSSGDSILRNLVGPDPAARPAAVAPRAADLGGRSPLQDPMPLAPAPAASADQGAFKIPEHYVPGTGDSQIVDPPSSSRSRSPASTFAKPTPGSGLRRSSTRRAPAPAADPFDEPSNRAPRPTAPLAHFAPAPAAPPPAAPVAPPPVAAPPLVPSAAPVPANVAHPVMSTAPASPAAVAPGEGFIDLAETLRAAGLQDIVVTPELARRFGEIIRAVVAGLIEMRKLREETLYELKMRPPSEPGGKHNPIDVSVDVDDALHNLLVKRSSAYLDPVSAVDASFASLRDHHMAMLAGMRDAFTGMLAQFDPEKLESEFDEMRRVALVAMPGTLRHWELYRKNFDGMVSDTERCFQRLFGARFAESYQEQLARLRAQHRAPRRDSTS